ncbi:DUF6438 domain-containing protein [Kordiimonas sp.]|uniref:DUF6438 domain-containing protein n=1 Tax=Kordiimonas sp. TaxID=1970157 RepID=UPI003A9359DE
MRFSRYTKMFSVTVVALMLAACATGGDGTSDAADGVGDVARDPSPMHYVKLSEGPCFGACPVYDLTIRGDGRITFHGNRFSKLSGQHLAQRSVGQFLEVLETLRMQKFTELDGAYDRMSCKMPATDHPTVTIEVRTAEINKSVQWYTGCRGFEDRRKLERLVDELRRVMDVDEFIGTDAERDAMRNKRRSK